MGEYIWRTLYNLSHSVRDLVSMGAIAKRDFQRDWFCTHRFCGGIIFVGGFQKFCKNFSEIVTRTRFLHKIFPKMTIVLQNSRQYRPDINLPLLGLSGNSCTIVCCSYLHSSDKTILIHFSSFQHIIDYSIKCSKVWNSSDGGNSSIGGNIC